MKNKYSPKTLNNSISSDYWISYTDIMSGLLIIFILFILSIIIINFYNENNSDTIPMYEYDKVLEENQKLKVFNEQLKIINERLEKINERLAKIVEKQRDIRKSTDSLIDNLMFAIQKRLKTFNIDVDVDQSNKTIHINENVLHFDTGNFLIPLQSKPKIKIISQVLNEILNKDSNKNIISYLDAILIEGHTDCHPYNNKQLEGNWGLSAMRAIKFWMELKTNHPELDNYINSDKKNLFSVSGYAATRPNARSQRGKANSHQEDCPINSNNHQINEESDSMDRRIDIRFTPFYEKLD